MTVADLGAGTGYMSRHLSRAVGPHGRVLAADTEPALVEHLRERAAREDTPNVTAIRAEAGDPHLPAHAVDVVLILDTYHHLDDRVRYLERLSNALRPATGRIAVVDWKREATPVGPPVEHRLSRERVVEEMAAAGYALREEPAILPYQYVLLFGRR
jgi:ubiquinone/menaquinone biosynthesis C-methylase UbiE